MKLKKQNYEIVGFSVSILLLVTYQYQSLSVTGFLSGLQKLDF